MLPPRNIATPSNPRHTKPKKAIAFPKKQPTTPSKQLFQPSPQNQANQRNGKIKIITNFNINGYSVLIHQALREGWRCQPLGLPLDHGHQPGKNNYQC
jgi:hypothetical protein